MRNKVLPVLITICALAFTIKYAYSDGPGNIRATKHNFSATVPTVQSGAHAVTEDQVCIFCHTPHSALTAGPLWNHTLSQKSSYIWYTSATMLAPHPASKPDGDSLLCLSCHDGDQPVGSVQNAGGQPTTISMTGTSISGGKITGTANFGSNLSGHHPISIEMNSCLVDDKNTLQCPSLITYKIRIPTGADTQFLKATASGYACATHPLTGVQCSSCHDAHSSNAMFLRVGNTGSWSTNYSDTLCCKCHIKCDDSPCP